MENTNENKAKFFAQYWGQKVVYSIYGTDYVNSNIIKEILYEKKELTIRLKRLSSITREDGIFIGKSIGLENATIYDKDHELIQIVDDSYTIGIYYTGVILMYKTRQPFWNDIPLIIDKIKYLGYALPYMGLSVEQLVSFGWVKLKEANNEPN